MRSTMRSSLQAAAVRQQNHFLLRERWRLSSPFEVTSSLQKKIPPRQYRRGFSSSPASCHPAASPQLTSQKESLRPRNHYEMFPQTLPSGPPPEGPFAVNIRELRKEFLQLQAQAHPDRHPQELKNRAEAASSLINEAYKTLQSPLLRAQYLLALRGIDVADDETARVEDPELLMEVLEMRETIEAVENEEELLPLKQENEGRMEASVKILEDAFQADDMTVAKEEAVKLRYWVNIKDSMDAWERGKPVVMIH